MLIESSFIPFLSEVVMTSSWLSCLKGKDEYNSRNTMWYIIPIALMIHSHPAMLCMVSWFDSRLLARSPDVSQAHPDYRRHGYERIFPVIRPTRVPAG